ncbi:MAG TPA: inositol monophosphatase [Patescibacteria group bacterium]|jgi:myo-inositol-1(or 4)-monophosphatase|nr:inositol monophosphatase [Patescibacteria group bacterium]
MENFIKNLAKGAGAILKNGYGKRLKISSKSAWWDLVTQYDLLADEFVINKIKARFPSHGILSEESGLSATRKNFWVIDPLDGTYAFARNLGGQFAVSIAFVSANQIKLAAVYAPVLNEFFFAKLRQGAFLNGKKISITNSRDNVELCSAAMVMGTMKTTRPERTMMYRNVVKYRLWLSRMESIALSEAYAAAGRYDLVMSKNLNPWDYAAGALILAEAGARVTDFSGRPYRWNSGSIVAANPKLHKFVIKNFKLPK